jgi:hypothetical protein
MKKITYLTRCAKLLYAFDYKGRYCVGCGLDSFEYPWSIDFHHRNPEEKEFCVKNKIYGTYFKNIKDELDKCDLLCCRCHRKIHFGADKFEENKGDILEKLNKLKSDEGYADKRREAWSEDLKNQILDLAKSGESMPRIAEIVNKEYHSVKNFLRSRFVKAKRPKRKRDKLPVKAIIALYTRNKNSTRFLAAKYKVSPGVIQDLLIEHGIEIRPAFFKLDISLVKQGVLDGKSNSEIAKEMGCRPGSISRIRKNEGF